MSQSLLRPDFKADIEDLRRRLGNLERRTTPAPMVGSSFGADPTHYVGVFAWWQKTVSVVSDDGIPAVQMSYTDAERLVTHTDTSPSGLPFWSYTGGNEIDFAPGIYSATFAMSMTVPASSAGKLVAHNAGFGERWVVAAAQEGRSNQLWASHFVIINTPRAPIFGAGLHTPINPMIGHNLGTPGVTSVSIITTLAVHKIGHVDA